MDRRLLDYLPPVLKDVLEFQAINAANEAEISLAWDATTLLLANQFLETADNNGVSVWERELRIHPKDTDSLELRKTRIKAMWNLELPYTIPWLKNWLTGLCGPTGHEEKLSGYTLNIQLDYNALPNTESLATEILNMLLIVCPANMQVLMDSSLQSYGTVAHGAFTQMSNTMDVWPRLVNELESQGSAAMTGTLVYSSRNEIYPKE